MIKMNTMLLSKISSLDFILQGIKLTGINNLIFFSTLDFTEQFSIVFENCATYFLIIFIEVNLAEG